MQKFCPNICMFQKKAVILHPIRYKNNIIVQNYTRKGANDDIVLQIIPDRMQL